MYICIYGMGGRPAMPAWPAGQILFLRGPVRRPPPGSIWRKSQPTGGAAPTCPSGFTLGKI